MALFRAGAFSAKLPRKVYWRMIAAAVLFGFPLTLLAFYGNYKNGWESQQTYICGEFLDYVSGLFIAFGWVGTIMLICKSSVAIQLQRCLQYVGRAAF
jgi:uncharacterized membrane protein YeiB